ncbi:MAG: glutathione S-transferase family protein [Planktothrix sp.]|uniref:glutathione S-transferase family protein n=1 Tax=Planktothrix sp. TaxID=3088171 RepID=UPI0038D3A4A1
MGQLTLVIGNKNYSSWSLRPWLVLKQVGLNFTEIMIDLGTPNTHKEIRHYSPSGKVPVLLDGDLTVWESLAICEYIAENFNSNLWPKDLEAKAYARSVSHEMHAGFINLRQQMPMNCRTRYPREGMKPGVQADIDRICAIWRECRQNYGTRGEFLFGKFTIADAIFAPVVSRFITYDVKLGLIEQDYVKTIWSLPAMQQWIDAACLEPEMMYF